MGHQIIDRVSGRTGMLVLLLMVLMGKTWGQQYFTKTGHVSFFSQAPMEKIEAYNQSAYVIMDAASGKVELSVLIKGFQFAKALMQDHFNENYMESHIYPKGIFKGSILNMKEVNLGKDGDYTANVSGNITMHGITRPLTTTGHIVVKGGKVTVNSKFVLTVADFNISIPKVVRDNIAKTVDVTVTAELQVLK